jgi:hypothetical protein
MILVKSSPLPSTLKSITNNCLGTIMTLLMVPFVHESPHPLTPVPPCFGDKAPTPALPHSPFRSFLFVVHSIYLSHSIFCFFPLNDDKNFGHLYPAVPGMRKYSIPCKWALHSQHNLHSSLVTNLHVVRIRLSAYKLSFLLQYQ